MSEWISVEDRLPEDEHGLDVLVITRVDEYETILIYRKGWGFLSTSDYRSIYYKPTHWKYLKPNLHPLKILFRVHLLLSSIFSVICVIVFAAAYLTIIPWIIGGINADDFTDIPIDFFRNLESKVKRFLTGEPS